MFYLCTSGDKFLLIIKTLPLSTHNLVYRDVSNVRVLRPGPLFGYDQWLLENEIDG